MKKIIAALMACALIGGCSKNQPQCIPCYYLNILNIDTTSGGTLLHPDTTWSIWSTHLDLSPYQACLVNGNYILSNDSTYTIINNGSNNSYHFNTLYCPH